jgi:hypothetical protein
MRKFKVRIDAVFLKEVEAEDAEAAKEIANDGWTMDDYVETGEIIVFKDDGVTIAPEDDRAVECQNCDWVGVESDLNPLEEQGIFDRVGPGETMPAGECPECGAVAHLKEETDA